MAINISRSKKVRRRSAATTILVAVCLIALFAVLGVILHLSSCGIDRANYQLEYKDLVTKYSNEYNVSDELIYAVIKTESNFDPNAESAVGAIGLMQIMPYTFEWLQNYYDGEVTMTTDSLYDPETSIKYGTRFLAFLLERYDNCEETAVAAYNAGFGAVDEWLSDENCSSDGVTLDYIPYAETSRYVEKVETAKENYKDVYHL